MSKPIPDPNGDRNCYRRWDHREAETVEVNGMLMCAECANPVAESTPEQ